MELKRLDHVALWVADRDAIADFGVAHLGMHVIERTDRFTLIGSHARRGKLTLFAEEPTREAGALAEIGLRVTSLEQALAALPPGHGERFEICDGLWIRLVEAETDVEYDLHHG
jgi:catechol 2,3-dioxygenase-like lactoylglutathione lyase family enzyme